MVFDCTCWSHNCCLVDVRTYFHCSFVHCSFGQRSMGLDRVLSKDQVPSPLFQVLLCDSFLSCSVYLSHCLSVCVSRPWCVFECHMHSVVYELL